MTREGADTWLRIIVAIGTLGEPPTNSHHCPRFSSIHNLQNLPIIAISGVHVGRTTSRWPSPGAASRA